MIRDFFAIKWTPESAAGWRETRAKGRRHFVLVHGVLIFGLFMFLTTTAINYFSNPEDFKLRDVVLRMIVNPLGGVFFGMLMWRWIEKSYAKYCEGLGGVAVEHVSKIS